MNSNKSIKRTIPDYEELFLNAETKNEKGKGSRILKTLFKKYSLDVFFSGFLYIIKSGGLYLAPLVTAEIINVVTRGDSDAFFKIIIYGIILAFLYLINYPLHIFYSKQIDEKLRDMGAGMRNTLVKKLQHLSITYHKEIESGKIQSKFLRDIEAIEVLCSTFIKSIVPCIITVLISIFIAASNSGIVTIFFLIVVPVNVILINLFRKPIKKSNYKYRKENETVSAKVSDMLEMIPVTKAHGLEEEEISNARNKIELLKEKALELDAINASFGSIAWIASQIMSGVCLIFTAYLALNNKIEPGDIVMYQSYFNSISNNITAIINLYPQLTKGVDSINSVSEIVLSNNVENNTGKIKLRYVHGSVNFDDVSFRYPQSDEDIIKDFTLSVEKGECIAFVGSSGSGKSTLMNMIIGFLTATKGSVRIDGKPIEALNLTEYRKFISVVPQNCILFTGSIKENITYGLTGISEEKLNEVIHLSNIDEFAKDLPNGLDTPVGENGTKLSGGQKQRISIARALIRDPKILILDEATSALDNISEYQVQKAINHLTFGRTTFIVAHRLSTIRNADRIVVMDKGRCVEMGTYDELINKRGKFYELKTLNEKVENNIS